MPAAALPRLALIQLRLARAPIARDAADNRDVGHGDSGDSGNSPWVTIATFWDPPSAHLARLRLESHGLLCILLDENLVATDWLLAQAAGGIKLKVQAHDAPRAAEILAPAFPLHRQYPNPLGDWVAARLESAWHSTRRLVRGAIRHCSSRWWLSALLPAALAISPSSRHAHAADLTHIRPTLPAASHA